MNKSAKLSFVTITLLPISALAQGLATTRGLIDAVGNLVESALVVVAGIALLAFFWGLMKFIFKIGNEDAVADGKRLMIWGLVALLVMVSVWGIIRVIRSEVIGVQNYDAPPVPTIRR